MANNHKDNLGESSSSVFARLEHLIATSSPSSMSTTNPPEPPSLASMLAALGTPTASIAILDHGVLATHMISTDSSHDPDTLFQACSISKPTAGFMIARLIDAGYFSLDSYMCDLLPADVLSHMTRDQRTARLVKKIQVRHLMSHTAGLAVHGFPGYPEELYPASGKSLPDAKEVLKGTRGVNTPEVKILAPPGLEFVYSGGGITVLQVIVEYVMDRSFEDLMREWVFEPLGMRRSCYRLSSEESNVAEAYYTGYTKCESRWHNDPELAACALWTTPRDLLKLVRGLQRSLAEDEEGALLS